MKTTNSRELIASYANRSRLGSIFRICGVVAAIAVLLAVASALLVNPRVPQGGTGHFFNNGTVAPTSGGWEILTSTNGVVATSASPNGWSVYMIVPTVIGGTSGEFYITAPANASLGTGFKIRYANVFVMQNGTRKSASGVFDVVPGPPAPPSGLTATPQGPAQINLAWVDNSNNETSFVVQKKVLPSGAWEQLANPNANTTTLSDNAVTPNTSFSYRVCSRNANGDSAWSNTATATTSPLTPTNLVATPGNQQVSLTWDASSGATSYNVKWATNAGGPYTTIVPPVTTNSYVHTNRTNGVRVYYVVSASNGTTESPNSAEASAVPDSVPNPPTDVVANPLNSTEIDVIWTDNANNETQFNIQRKVVGATIWEDAGTVLANVTTFEDTLRTPNTSYQYRVRATNQIGSSDWVEASAVSTPLIDSPMYITAFATSTSSIRLYWTKVDGATSYNIYRGTSPGVVPNGSPLATISASTDETLFYDDPGLTENQDYYYVVTALQGVNESAASFEDSHFPNASAIPWNSTATDVMNRVRLTAASLSGNPMGIPVGNTYLLTPNGQLLSDIDYLLHPNLAGWSPIGGLMNYGTYQFPSFMDLHPATGTGAPTGPLPKIAAEGAYRKVVAVPSSTATIIGTSCTYYLPDSDDTSSFRVNQTYESPHAYVGFDLIGGGPSAEGGVQFCPAKVVDGVSYPNRWQAILRISDGRHNSYDDRFIPPFMKALEKFHLPVKCITLPFGANRLNSHQSLGMGSYVVLVFFVDLPSRMVYFNAYGGDVYGTYYIQSFAIPMKIDYDMLLGQRALKNPRLRRVVSLAQLPQNISNPIRFSNRPPENSWPNAYGATGSRYANVGFGNGLLWTNFTSESWFAPVTWSLSPLPYNSLPCTTSRFAGGNEMIDIQH